MDRFSYSRNGGVDLSCSVRVAVSGTVLVDGKTYYKVAMKTVKTTPVKSWEVVHRYSEFLALKQTLLALLTEQHAHGKACPGCQHYMHALEQFDFPRKHLFSSNSAMVIKYRQISLQAFVAMLASHTFVTTPRCPTCSGTAFELVRDFFTAHNNPSIVEKLPSPIKEVGKSESLRTALTVDNFLETHPVPRDTVVGSTGEFVSSPAKPSPGEPSPSRLKPPPVPTTATNASPAKPRNVVQPKGSEASPPKAEKASPSKAEGARVDAPLDVDRYSFESGVPLPAKTPPLEHEESDGNLSFEGLRVTDDDIEDDDINMDFLAKLPVHRQTSQPTTL
ncbi:hypothetical protein ACHHYP_05513 [Achlya hypogyna]|uniref:PX domain-containing protein n=1 Tax=Achlya hypogyna TaxID=1202772 RepID=A0A1V9YXS5_ACHHY|nr:hypothetical protein ACHHYP_05513 [Achlya hypogyna]